MQVNGIESYPAPRYPDKDAVLNDRSLIYKLPERWKRNAAATAALTASLSMLGGCVGGNTATPTHMTTPTPTVSETSQSPTDGDTPSPKPAYTLSLLTPTPTATPTATIWRATPTPTPKPFIPTVRPYTGLGRAAPLFVHGDGVGNYVCVSVTQPTYFTEEEALQIINDTAYDEGLAFKTVNGKFLRNIDIPVPNTFIHEFSRIKKGDLELDGYIGTENIMFEYISGSDYRKWVDNTPPTTAPGATPVSYVSANSYGYKEAAGILLNGMNSHTEGKVVAVFYDPATKYDSTFITPDVNQKHPSYEQACEISRQELAAQVRDFIRWLKAEGII